MKANELMIGDWVKQIHSAWPFKIAGISMSGVTKEGPYYYEYDKIEPIPLTPEILEKNGFENDRGIYSWKDENKQITYFSKENNRPYCTYSFVNIESGCLNVDELPIEYVHELQHTLRLCGIKIEIEL